MISSTGDSLQHGACRETSEYDKVHETMTSQDCCLGGVQDYNEAETSVDHPECSAQLVSTKSLMRTAAVIALSTWSLAVAVVYCHTPPESFEYFDTSNWDVLILAAAIFATTSQLALFVFRSNVVQLASSGALELVVVIKLITLATELMIFFFPMPVLADPFTGMLHRPVRWLQWTIVASMTTLLTETVSRQNQEAIPSEACFHAGLMGMSMFAGIMFPFCSSSTECAIVAITSIVHLSTLVRRLSRDRHDSGVKGEVFRQPLNHCTLNVSVWVAVAASWVMCALSKHLTPKTSATTSGWIVVATERFVQLALHILYGSLLYEFNNDEASRTSQKLKGFVKSVRSKLGDVFSLGCKVKKCETLKVVSSLKTIAISLEEVPSNELTETYSQEERSESVPSKARSTTVIVTDGSESVSTSTLSVDSCLRSSKPCYQVGQKRSMVRASPQSKDSFTNQDVMSCILTAMDVVESLKEISGSDDDGTSETSQCSSSEDSLQILDRTNRFVVSNHVTNVDFSRQECLAKEEAVNVPELLSNVNDSRFPVTTEPANFPKLMIDSRYLRNIHQNAVSNATRFGEANGKISTHLSYDEKTQQFRMEVTNSPGPGHKHLVARDPIVAKTAVFTPGASLHRKSSSASGAWMMQKCAQALKGQCDIRFYISKTVFSFQCPAKTCKSRTLAEVSSAPCEFSLPPRTWGIAIDDSGIQRKLMERFLKLAGIASDRRVVVGKTAQDIYGFCDMVVDLLKKHPNDKFLAIVDENLIVEEDGVQVSGSVCIQKILDRLSYPQESRFLGLVRSANDSEKDVALYKSRTHGYLTKAPIGDSKRVLGVIKPWWEKRFATASAQKQLKPVGRRSCYEISRGPLIPPVLKSGIDDLFTSSFREMEIADPLFETGVAIEVIDALCSRPENISNKRWRCIQDRLEMLKGGLTSSYNSSPDDSESLDELEKVVEAIDDLRQSSCPENLSERWADLRVDVTRFSNQSIDVS